MRYIFIFLFLTYSAYSQHADQPLKENSQDLRSTTALFMITDMEVGKSYLLERTAGLDHFLIMKDEKEVGSIKKTDTRDAKKLDQEFAGRFLRIQYELPTATGDCEVVWKLFMKGETQNVCQKDDQKSQEVKVFVDQLKKRF